MCPLQFIRRKEPSSDCCVLSAAFLFEHAPFVAFASFVRHGLTTFLSPRLPALRLLCPRFALGEVCFTKPKGRCSQKGEDPRVRQQLWWTKDDLRLWESNEWCIQVLCAQFSSRVASKPSAIGDGKCSHAETTSSRTCCGLAYIFADRNVVVFKNGKNEILQRINRKELTSWPCSGQPELSRIVRFAAMRVQLVTSFLCLTILYRVLICVKAVWQSVPGGSEKCRVRVRDAYHFETHGSHLEDTWPIWRCP